MTSQCFVVPNIRRIICRVCYFIYYFFPSKSNIFILNFIHPNQFYIEFSHKGRKLHDYRQYMRQQSAPSVNGRSDKPVVIFDSVFF